MEPFKHHATIVGLCFCFFSSAAADLDFYGQFVSLVNRNELRPQGVTNVLLVDVHNTAPKLTNSIIPLEDIRTEGRVGSIQLGMTMQDVVSRWGKPIWMHPNCDGGHKFNFTDCSLVFVGNSLKKVRFPNAISFGHGLSANSNLKAWREALGEPTISNAGAYGSSAVYEEVGKVRTVLFLSFEPDGEVKFPPVLYLDPPLTNWFKKGQL